MHREPFYRTSGEQIKHSAVVCETTLEIWSLLLWSQWSLKEVEEDRHRLSGRSACLGSTNSEQRQELKQWLLFILECL